MIKIKQTWCGFLSVTKHAESKVWLHTSLIRGPFSALGWSWFFTFGMACLLWTCICKQGLWSILIFLVLIWDIGKHQFLYFVIFIILLEIELNLLSALRCIQCKWLKYCCKGRIKYQMYQDRKKGFICPRYPWSARIIAYSLPLSTFQKFFQSYSMNISEILLKGQKFIRLVDL